jgi:(4-alkanoyl-5-oxo-2,5-dihydrofuran-3-yl)methyl phosphate reductase
MRGAHSLFLVNVGPGIPERDQAAATIAREEGIRRIVKRSSLDIEHGLAIGAWHEKGEPAIRASGEPLTFVRRTGFMSNLQAWADSIQTEGIVRSSTGEGGRPYIHSGDIAEASVATVLDDDYAGRILSITGQFADLWQCYADHCPRHREAESAIRESAALRKRLRLMWRYGVRSVKATSRLPRMKLS